MAVGRAGTRAPRVYDDGCARVSEAAGTAGIPLGALASGVSLGETWHALAAHVFCVAHAHYEPHTHTVRGRVIVRASLVLLVEIGLQGRGIWALSSRHRSPRLA